MILLLLRIGLNRLELHCFNGSKVITFNSEVGSLRGINL